MLVLVLTATIVYIWNNTYMTKQKKKSGRTHVICMPNERGGLGGSANLSGNVRYGLQAQADTRLYSKNDTKTKSGRTHQNGMARAQADPGCLDNAMSNDQKSLGGSDKLIGNLRCGLCQPYCAPQHAN